MHNLVGRFSVEQGAVQMTRLVHSQADLGTTAEEVLLNAPDGLNKRYDGQAFMVVNGDDTNIIYAMLTTSNVIATCATATGGAGPCVKLDVAGNYRLYLAAPLSLVPVDAYIYVHDADDNDTLLATFRVKSSGSVQEADGDYYLALELVDGTTPETSVEAADKVVLWPHFEGTFDDDDTGIPIPGGGTLILNPKSDLDRLLLIASASDTPVKVFQVN